MSSPIETIAARLAEVAAELDTLEFQVHGGDGFISRMVNAEFRAKKAEAENARLRDALARVEALVASLARGGFRDKAIAASLRAALAGGDS